MIDLREIDGAICDIERSSLNNSSATLLASLYTIRNQITGNIPATLQAEQPSLPARSFSGMEPLDKYGDSDFLRAVSGKESSSVWEVMDDLMDTLRAVNIRVYNSVMERIRNL